MKCVFGELVRFCKWNEGGKFSVVLGRKCPVSWSHDVFRARKPGKACGWDRQIVLGLGSENQEKKKDRNGLTGKHGDE